MTYNILATCLLSNGFTPDQILHGSGLAIGTDNQILMPSKDTDVLVLHNEQTGEIAILETNQLTCYDLSNLKQALLAVSVYVTAMILV